MHQIHNFINGEFLPPKSDQYLDNVNPSTGIVHGQIPDSSYEDVQEAVTAAEASFKQWKLSSIEERATYLHAIAQGIKSKFDDFALAESQDQGKPLWLAKKMDIDRSIANFEFYASAINHYENNASSHKPGVLNYSSRRPLGIAGLITPWNLPLYLLTWKIAPALAMGNTVICKPSEVTPLTAYMLAKVIAEVGLPPGVCNFVFGSGEKVGQAIVEHPKVPLISFTGSTASGRSIAEHAAPHFKKLSLELGGKNPSLIFASADLDKVIPETIRSSFLNQGEICLCTSRIFVEKSLYDKFVEGFCEKVKEIKTGNPLDETNFLGAIASEEHLNKIEHYVKIAQDEGGNILVGGHRSTQSAPWAKGYFFEPTVITGLDASSRVMQDEIFGPVVTISSFESEHEACQLANSVPYGLAATIWTSQLEQAHRVSEAMESGLVWVNTWLNRDLKTPFGGSKQSGIGREGGRYSLEFYSEAKNTCIKF